MVFTNDFHQQFPLTVLINGFHQRFSSMVFIKRFSSTVFINGFHQTVFINGFHQRFSSAGLILLYRNAGFAKKRHGIVVGISIYINDALYTRIDNHFRAKDTGLMRTVKRRAGCLDAMDSRLYNSVLFGMDGAAFLVHRSRRNILNVADATDVQAVGKPARRAVIAGRQNPVITNNDGTDLVSKAGRTLSDSYRNLNKIFIYRKPLIRHMRNKGKQRYINYLKSNSYILLSEKCLYFDSKTCYSNSF